MSSMTNGNGNNIDRLLGRLIERTESFSEDLKDLKVAVENLANAHHERIVKLEFTHAESTGSKKAVWLIGAIAGGITAAVYHVLSVLRVWSS